MESLEEMAKLLDTYALSKLNHKYIESLNIPIMNFEIEPVIKSLSKKKSQPDVVALACNPSTWETEAGGSRFVASLSYLVKPSAT